MKKVCPRCGAAFECLHGTPQMALCHCATIRLTPGQLVYLKTHFQGCLCHDCLTAIAALPL